MKPTGALAMTLRCRGLPGLVCRGGTGRSSDLRGWKSKGPNTGPLCRNTASGNGGLNPSNSSQLALRGQGRNQGGGRAS